MPLPLPFALFSTLVLLVAIGAPARAATIIDPGQGPVFLPANPPGLGELSGLTYVGGSQYYSVNDGGGFALPIEIVVDGATGFVSSSAFGSPVALAGGVDLEGVAFDASDGTILVSDEQGPAIRRHDPSDGALLDDVTVPSIYTNARPNLSLESLTLQSGGAALWTANEAALFGDGPTATETAGTVVRLQRFDETLAPSGQWAYGADALPGGLFLGVQASGVVDMAALPNGELLVLERAVGEDRFRSRIYQVGFDGATDVSLLSDASAPGVVPVEKTLLWEGLGFPDNFEGLAVGPELEGGDHSLLLVSDGAGFLASRLYALRMRFVPEPSPLLLLAVAVAASQVVVSNRRRQKSPRRGRNDRA